MDPRLRRALRLGLRVLGLALVVYAVCFLIGVYVFLSANKIDEGDTSGRHERLPYDTEKGHVTRMITERIRDASADDRGENLYDFGEGRNDTGDGRSDLGEGRRNYLGEGHNDLGEGHNDLGEGHNDLDEGHKELDETRNDIGEGHNDLNEGHNELGDKEKEVDKSSTSDQTKTKTSLSSSEVKALADVCRRMNFTLENPENGIGEFAAPIGLSKADLSAADQERWDAGYNYAGYNVFLSDKMALRRRLPNWRPELCNNITYPSHLPQASVIIPYHKEALSMLMRTVISILDRAPAHLLKEVIIVDDFSQTGELLGPLDELVSYLPKVRVLRNSQREGLMRTRMRGVMAATAPVVVLKDAHTECFPGWLEPLLAAVAANRTTVAWSHMFAMNYDNYQLSRRTPTSLFAFNFHLLQEVVYMPAEVKRQIKSPIDPVPTPIIGGTEFAIEKKFFLEIGGYDPGMEIWGGEEMELSFKTWMCGGSMKIIPCSCVTHLFRQARHRTRAEHIRNAFRVAQVWMDEYKDEVYERYGNDRVGLDIGNITDRRNLREKLQCKSFRWYMDNVAYMVDLRKESLTQGELHNVGKSGWCLVTDHKHKVFGDTCHGAGYLEFWIVTKSGFIRSNMRCLSYNTNTNDTTLTWCSEDNPNLRWKFTESKNIIHQATGKCLSLRDKPGIEECLEGEQLEQWEIVHRDPAPSI